ncbi:hypothetical protein LCGC14_0232300 [marine sediment metagenome]|uniref:Uncharacterized protein n=1 Tax=marine sediment metagenome TaxID=412755 RepID=A0A0F9UEL5_9ZZZZ
MSRESSKKVSDGDIQGAQHPSLIEVGDHVKIIKPMNFIRCGYGKEFSDFLEAAELKAAELLESTGIDYTIDLEIFRDTTIYIQRLLERAFVSQHPEKKIYEKELSMLKGLITQVCEIRTCKTGIWNYPEGHLRKQKVHKLLLIIPPRQSSPTKDTFWLSNYLIREVHVIKVPENYQEIEDKF